MLAGDVENQAALSSAVGEVRRRARVRGPTHHVPAGVLELIHDGHFVAVVVVAAGLGVLCDNVHRLLDEVVKVHEVFVPLGDFDVAQACAHKPRAVCVRAVNTIAQPSDAVSANLPQWDV